MWNAMVTSIANMMERFFAWRTSLSDNQAIDEVIDDKEKTEKATYYAQKALQVAKDKAVILDKKDRFVFNFYYNKFLKTISK